MGKYLFCFLVCSSFLFSKDISFMDAWNKLVQKSDILKAKKEDLKNAKFRQEAARDLYWPELSISALYTHLEKPVEFSGKSILQSSDNKDVSKIVEGIAKGSSNATYNQALSSGKSQNEAIILAKQNANDILSSVNSLKNSVASSSFELVKQDSINSSISAMWPIYTGGKIEATQIVAKGEVDEAFAVIELSKLEQFENLAKTYFTVVLLKDVKKTKEEAANVLRRHYEQALKLQKYGQIAKIEVLSAQVNFDKAKIEANKVRKQLEIAKNALAQMVHEDNVQTNTKLFINNRLPNLKFFKNQTLKFYPIFKVLEAKKKKTNGLIMAKKSSYYPNLFIYGNHNVYRDKTPTSNNLPNWFVGVGLNYKILDNKGRSGQLDAAYSTKKRVYYLQQQMNRDIGVLVDKTYKELLLAFEEYNDLSSSVKLGFENVKLHEKSFAQGLSTSMSVVDAQLFLESVKTQRSVALYNYILAYSKLLALSNQINNFTEYK